MNRPFIEATGREPYPGSSALLMRKRVGREYMWPSSIARKLLRRYQQPITVCKLLRPNHPLPGACASMIVDFWNFDYDEILKT
jgi:hypothetical protein